MPQTFTQRFQKALSRQDLWIAVGMWVLIGAMCLYVAQTYAQGMGA